MKIKEPKNSNYCATVIKITTLKPLENADRVQGAIIFGNQVIVSLDTKIGDIGLYFPLETQLSHEYCHANNLYRHKELNSDENEVGYFEDNKRVKCMKFRGNKSEGIFMPIDSLMSLGVNPVDLKIGDEFDELATIPICNKYVLQYSRIPGAPGSKKDKKKAKGYESKLVDNQFRFHQDTSMLYKNLFKIKPDSLISITYKLHGTSGISSRILCKKKLSRRARFLKWIGVDIVDTHYDYIISSRKVIKNEELLSPNAIHYYKEDIWTIAHNDLKEFIQDGMTLYYEIVGSLPGGGAIQKSYDYGYPINNKNYGIYIYRITYTNISGKVFEFSAKQVQDWCHFNGLNAVPQLFYGYAKDFVDNFELITNYPDTSGKLTCKVDKEFISSDFLERIKKEYNEKDCYMCNTIVPEEGCVIRIEKEDFEAYKAKSNKFYERETKELDKGTFNIEEEN